MAKSMRSLNGDHTVRYQYVGLPNPGSNDILAQFGYDNLGGGLAKMTDGRILAVMQNTAESTNGEYGYVPWITARFVSTAGNGDYVTIFNGDTHFGAGEYTSMKAAYQQVLPLGDAAVVGFWYYMSSNDSGYGMILLDVTGSTPVVVDTLHITGGLYEPDIGKVADDIFLYWDTPTGGISATAYRATIANGFEAGSNFTASVPSTTYAYSNGIAGVDGEFLTYIECNTSVSASGVAAWLGTVNTSTLAISHDATVAIPETGGKWPGNAAINLSMTVRLPEPRIGIVAGNYDADQFEIERIGNSAQISNYYIEPTNGEAWYHYNVGRSWPIAYNTAGEATMYYQTNSTPNGARFWEVVDVFGTPTRTQIFPETDWPAVAAEYKLTPTDNNWGSAFTLEFDGATPLLHVNAPSWEPYEPSGDYNNQVAGPPYGQYWLIYAGLIGQLYVNLSTTNSEPNWISVCPEDGHLGYFNTTESGSPTWTQVHLGDFHANVTLEGEPAWYTCCSHG